MTFLQSLGAVASASDDGPIDWAAVVDAATASTPPGSLAVDARERAGFADDVRAAHEAIEAASGIDFPVPSPVEVQDRHHWIDANAATFERLLAPVADRRVLLPGVASRVNTATVATMLSVLSRHVLGQYDPGLFGDEPRLYFVLPNLRTAATSLDVEYDLFRRWIAFHEVAHTAEFAAAPWLTDHLVERIERAVGGLAEGTLDTGAVRDLDVTMTAIEGYAEFVMDRAFDRSAADLRAKVDARRRGGGPLTRLIRRLFGFGLKHRQYERGRRFFDEVADARGVAATAVVWREPRTLPTAGELSSPSRWLIRVDP